ncbi:MAG: SDR family oxidoreductase [Rhodoplanes sp.]|uniref:SDR family NAD(P)-dependent oxidoreductase n=1 Tax=Rhodoplanes sp. TaxID=1968906 RepID=UPI00183279EC|nr:SDR family oxidoreductase [Rhodoplanes sp.]NVO17562.1 SDR family oxidoreductase [Rhodoplanes sp.]
MNDQKKPVAIVTGASYGVGAATARALAEAGFALVLTATRAENLGETVASLADMAPVAAVGLDLASQASIDTVVPAALAQFGRIDLLVNNAGRNLRRKAVDVTRRDWDDLIGANLTGTFFLTQQVGRHLIAQASGGRIVTIASVHGLVGAGERSVYGISKAGLLQMTRMLAVEWADHGITVNAIAPGRLDTPSPSRAGTGTDPAYMAAMLTRIPLHRLATAEEVAAAVVFLAGAAAASITGQTLVIDGGLTVV